MTTLTRSNAKGFSLVEIIIVVGVISVMMLGATVLTSRALAGARADGSAALALNTLRLARDRAIGERRNMDLVFTSPNRVRVSREEIGGAPNVTVIDVYLENGQKFTKFTEISSDTPDLFGLTNSPIAFGPTQGTIPTIMFTSEGTLVDGNGDTINGTLFFGTPGVIASARAITIFGPTALIRTWRWDGIKWIE